MGQSKHRGYMYIFNIHKLVLLELIPLVSAIYTKRHFTPFDRLLWIWRITEKGSSTLILCPKSIKWERIALLIDLVMPFPKDPGTRPWKSRYVFPHPKYFREI